MTTQLSTKTQTEPKKLIFAHRLDQTNAHDIGAVTDAVGLMTDRARGILYMLFGHFEGETRYNNQIIQGAINAAINEIDDIDDALQAHWDIVSIIKPG